MSNELCDICGEREADTLDGMVGAFLCDQESCFHRAWDEAYGSGADE